MLGLALNEVLVKGIRWYVGNQVKKEYVNVKTQKGIDSQSKSGRLREWSFAFDEECDLSTILGLLTTVPVFSDSVKQAASNVRQVRNFWAHSAFHDWDSAKFNKCFDDMEQLVKVLGLPRGDEEHLVNELNDWKKKGTSA